MDTPAARALRDYSMEMDVFTHVRGQGIIMRYQDKDNYVAFRFNVEESTYTCVSFIRRSTADGDETFDRYFRDLTRMRVKRN